MRFGSLASLRSGARNPRFFPSSAPSLDDQAAAFFAARATPKMWIDPSVATGRYADSSGLAAAINTGGIGLILDRAQGVGRGPEIFSNGTFDSNINGWTAGVSTYSSTGTWEPYGALTVSGTSTNFKSKASPPIPTIIGKVYEMLIDVLANVGGGYYLILSDSQTSDTLNRKTIVAGGSGVGRRSFVFTATSTATYLHVTAGPTSDASITVDNISTKEAPGNHVIQSAALGKRPTLLQANGLSWISADGSDDGLYTGAPLDLSSVDRVTLIAGFRKRNSDATVMLAEHGAEFTTGGALGLYSSSASPQAYFQWGVSGASGNPTPIIASPSPTDTCVIVATAWLGATSGVSMRIERITAGGTAAQDDTSIPGARNFKSDVLNLLCRNNASLFAPFDMSSFMLIGGPALTAAELLLLKRATCEKTGIVL